jgi:hypothetical protein
MKLVISFAALLVPTLASANPGYSWQPSLNIPNYNTDSRIAEGRELLRSSDTPTMRRMKLARAIELRAEAARLLSEDGGTLTSEHEAYIRRKAHAILEARR